MLAGLGILVANGCRDSKKPAEAGNTPAGEQTAATTSMATSAAVPRAAAVPQGAGANFYPVPLDSFYQKQFMDYRPTDSWAQVPQGETNLDNVPFLMFGKIDLTGLGRARDGEFQPPQVGEIPVGRRATRFHLIHGASYDSPIETPVACVLLRYENGEARRFFLRYGVHTRNWYVETKERNMTVTDPGSLVVWNGFTNPGGGGTPTRLYKTTFENPFPDQVIRGIELRSLFARANPVFLAITLEDSPGPKATANPVPEDEDDSRFRREDSLRVADVDSGQPVAGAGVRLSVREAGRTYRFGVYSGDADGRVRIVYPPGKIQAFLLDVAAPGYAAAHLELSGDDGILGNDLPVRLKKEPAP